MRKINRAGAIAPAIPAVARRIALRAFGFSAVVGTWACAPSEAPTSPLRSLRPASMAAASESKRIPGQYIVTFADSEKDVPGLVKKLAGEQAFDPMFTYTAAVKGFAAKLTPQAVEALSHNPHIASIEEDQALDVSGTELGADWGLDRLDQRTGLDGSYSYASDGSGVNAYIIDTGIRTTHVEFGGRAFGAYSAISDGNGTNDCNGHGTHVAGTVGGVRYGVAKGVRLFAVRVLGCSGSGATSAVIAGIDWVTKNRVLPAVANMSVETPKSATVNTAVQNSIAAGVVYAVAAGNDASDACNYSPASASAALTVGASWNGDGMAGYSNFGSCVDLFAPGSAITSAYIANDSSTMVMGGTSMATPHVAGVAALYLSVYPTATPSQVVDAVLLNATSGVLSAIPSGTPNLLLFSGVTGTASAPTVPPPTPSADTAQAPPATDNAPTASFSASSCPKGKCSFDASASTDDHGVVGYTWSFGDGSAMSSAASLVKVTHTYVRAGTYTVTLTVRDAAGQQGSTTKVLIFKRL